MGKFPKLDKQAMFRRHIRTLQILHLEFCEIVLEQEVQLLPTISQYGE